MQLGPVMRVEVRGKDFVYHLLLGLRVFAVKLAQRILNSRHLHFAGPYVEHEVLVDGCLRPLVKRQVSFHQTVGPVIAPLLLLR